MFNHWTWRSRLLVAESLARFRCELTIVDPDSVCVSNINRQLIAVDSTVGMSKVEAMKKEFMILILNALWKP